jgi:hypothetical protein
MTKKGIPWLWSAECQKVFDLLQLKLQFSSAKILRHFDTRLPVILETDASDFSIGSVISQQHPDGLHPVSLPKEASFRGT